MKKSIGLIFAIFALVCGLSFEANAQQQDKRAGVNKHQRHQQKRIFQGVKSKELTRKEFYRLEKEQNQIRRMEKRFKSDGKLTKRERAKLAYEQKQASRHIYKQKHDKQDRE